MKKIIIILVVLVIISFGGYLVYDKILKKDNGVVNKDNNNEVSYIMMQSNTIGTTSSNEKLFINYPMISYENDSIKKLNNIIKDNVNKSIEEVNSYSGNTNDNCLKIKLDNAEDYKIYDYFIYNKYYLYDTDKYLSIVEVKKYSSSCLKEYSVVESTYVVDKSSKNVLYSNDLIKLIDANKLNKVINGESNNELDKNNIYIYYNNDNEMIVVYRLGNGKYNFYKYTDNEYMDVEVEDILK